MEKTTRILLEIDNEKFKESFSTFAIYLLLNDICKLFEGIKYRTLVDDEEDTLTKINY